ncbi:MAG TPA: LysR family transcriptional regulator [Baekduia sp.]|uniref:LysR family transcriptional regulator n=1 Tax=Baekduia sp. TaxID=2600305 RepID=UPI002C7D55E7|nr:LysR family transcriptional regulator [Baekduia sp.]HMJ33533.1 LysR family transcriptional regulator [Baekduia sp.]
MDLRQLEYFAAVARHRHFRRAAEDLYVTQSAVSQQVRRLEAELGLALLRRTPRGVEVTPAGEELLARAEAILADVAGARAAMDEHAGTLRGGVRAAATTGDALRLAPALARFGAEHPGVRIALRQGAPGEVVELVAKGSVDVAVAALPGGAAGAGALGDELDAVALGDEPLVLLVAPDDPLAGATGVRLWDVRDRSFVLGEPGTALRESVLAACAEQGFGPVPLFEVGEPTAVRFLVGAGLGVSLVPASWLAVPGPEVGVAAPAAPLARHALSLLSRRAGLAPVARLLHEHLRATLGAGGV